MKPKTLLKIRRIAGAAIVLTTVLVFVFHRPVGGSAKRSDLSPAALRVPVSDPGSDKTSSTDAVALRPLPIALRSAAHEWTSGDGNSPEIIQKLAHNPDEFIRMVEENERIKRRQLVYRKETVPMLLERGRSAAGQTLKSFTLPGLDGKEVEVEVTEIHEEPSLHGGSVTGRVKGRFNSMVSVGFVNGSESFNVFSPDDNLYLTADAREPGEVIVKEIDPEKYAPVSGNEPDFILTHEPLPKNH